VPVDETKLNNLLGQTVSDLGAAINSILVIMGDKLGLYKAVAEAGSVTSGELADRTGTTERYVREWLAAQAASGYIEYEAENERFSMTEEQQAVFADEDSPVLMTGGFYGVAVAAVDEPELTEAFRKGEGVPWGDHYQCLFCGTEKFFRPSYRANLVPSWIPALTGVEEKLKRGAKVADVGCGHGVSTITMAEAYPDSSFVGFDFHEPSIARARELAQEAGVDNARFDVATAKNYPGSDYDLVAFFDCLHDMGDPVGAVAHTRSALKQDGTLLLVEPFAHDTLEENLNPVGRVYYGFSTVLCTPSSISQEVGLALGAQAGEARLRNVAEAGGFTHFRRAAETPFNLILEARP
jgi:SAM-dependent methyltransferase